MSDEAKNILILGIGNDILSDDGIGPRLVEEIEKKMNQPDVTFLTAAAGGMDILELIRDFPKVIIIDAIKTENGVPGTVYYLTPSDFRETLHISSFHDISFLTALDLGEKLAIAIPKQIHIIAIEIVEDLIFSDQFSPRIAEKYDHIRQEVMEMVQKLVKNNSLL
jgi:hydrogenase maturation protease